MASNTTTHDVHPPHGMSQNSRRGMQAHAYKVLFCQLDALTEGQVGTKVPLLAAALNN